MIFRLIKKNMIKIKQKRKKGKTGAKDYQGTIALGDRYKMISLLFNSSPVFIIQKKTGEGLKEGSLLYKKYDKAIKELRDIEAKANGILGEFKSGKKDYIYKCVCGNCQNVIYVSWDDYVLLSQHKDEEHRCPYCDKIFRHSYKRQTIPLKVVRTGDKISNFSELMAKVNDEGFYNYTGDGDDDDEF